jgi:two-component system, LytTR family, sensor kinase
MNIIKLLRFKPYQKLIGYPLLGLIVWFAFDYILTLGQKENNEVSHILFQTYLPLTAIFFINYLYLLPNYYAKNQKSLYIILSVVLLLITAFVRLYDNSKSDLSDGSTFFYGIYWNIQYFAFSFGYWYMQNAVRRERKRNRSEVSKQRLEQLKNELEKSVLASELNFLKLQINPHFLYNALNTFYAQAIPVSMPLADGILTLSNIMRYAVEGSKSDAKVSLSREIDHIKNLINIQRLRFGSRFYMKLEYDGYIEAKQIPPLIFITFVENIFKHGEIHDEKDPASIKIFASPYDILFLTHNKKKTDGHKEPSTNIGIHNTLQRLNAFYPGRYELDMNDEGDYYSCKLKIKT